MKLKSSFIPEPNTEHKTISETSIPVAQSKINAQKLSAPEFIDLRTFDRLWLYGYDYNNPSPPQTLDVLRYQVMEQGCNRCRQIGHRSSNTECWRTQNPVGMDIPYEDGYAPFYSQDNITEHLVIKGYRYKCVLTDNTKSSLMYSVFQRLDGEDEDSVDI